jgi:hypothetical protein
LLVSQNCTALQQRSQQRCSAECPKEKKDKRGKPREQNPRLTKARERKKKFHCSSPPMVFLSCVITCFHAAPSVGVSDFSKGLSAVRGRRRKATDAGGRKKNSEKKKVQKRRKETGGPTPPTKGFLSFDTATTWRERERVSSFLYGGG